MQYFHMVLSTWLVVLNFSLTGSQGHQRLSLRTADVSPRSSAMIEEKRLPFAGYQRLFSVKYLFGEASIVENCLLRTAKNFSMTVPLQRRIQDFS